VRALRGREKKLAMAERALADLERWAASVSVTVETASRQSVA